MVRCYEIHFYAASQNKYVEAFPFCIIYVLFFALATGKRSLSI